VVPQIEGGGGGGDQDKRKAKDFTFVNVDNEHASRTSKRVRLKRQQFTGDGTMFRCYYAPTLSVGSLAPMPIQSDRPDSDSLLMLPLPLLEFSPPTPSSPGTPPPPPPPSSPLESLHPSLLAFALPHREDEFVAELEVRLRRVMRERKDLEWDLDHAELWKFCICLPDD
jgi:hypothetical protein